MNGLINLYKPSGMSSAQAVAKVRHILGQKTVGHMGTLDPMAEGVLVIGVGKSARLFDYLLRKEKSYIAKFKFGYETDTLDALGTVTQTTPDIPSADAVLGAVRSMIGRIEQIPPIYSAKHIGGRRAYSLARGGAPEQPKPVTVEIYDACLIAQPKPDELVFSIDCSGGTYIRSICRDAARLCGSLATLTYLQRTRSGIFKVSDSISLESLGILGENALIRPENVIDLPRFDVSGDDYAALCNGIKLRCAMHGEFLVYCRDEFFGIGENADGTLRIKTYLKDGQA